MRKIAALLAIVALTSCGNGTSTTEVESCDSTVCTDSTSVCVDSTAVLVDSVEVETK
jgi:hypothetical protein